MFRVRLIVSIASVAIAAALAGCSGSSMSMPDWMSFSKSPPPLATMQFESTPPGADVRTSQGQTCQTPCALAIPPESQAVSFTKTGFLPQIGADHRRAAARSFALRKPAADIDPQSSGCHAATGEPATPRRRRRDRNRTRFRPPPRRRRRSRHHSRPRRGNSLHAPSYCLKVQLSWTIRALFGTITDYLKSVSVCPFKVEKLRRNTCRWAA